MPENNFKELVNQLGEPANYFKGVSASFSTLPKEIVIFKRNKAIRDRVTIHQRFIIVLSISGSGGVVINNNLFQIEPGHGAIIFPHQSHFYVQFKKESISWLFIGFEFDDENALLPLRDSPFRIDNISETLLQELLGNYLKTMDSESNSNTTLSIQLARLIDHILGLKLENAPNIFDTNSSPSHKKMNFLSKINRYIYDHIHEAIRINDLARHVCISESHLRKTIREVVGVSLGELIQRTQIHKSCALLKDTDMNITAIAEACGFSSIHTFSRAFKKRTKKTPSEYRKSSVRLNDNAFEEKS